MTKIKYVTHIFQYKVKIIKPEDWDEYKYNCPGTKWKLIEYVNVKQKDGTPIRVWCPNYSLQYDKFTDLSKVKITGV